MELLEQLFKTHNRLVMVGGSGMYIDALCNGLDDFPPADLKLRDSLMKRLQEEGIGSLRNELRVLDRVSYDTIDIANPQRVVRALEVTLQTGRKFSDWRKNQKKERPFSIRKIGIMRDREELYDRINRRVDIMMDNGLLDEVKSLKQFEQMPALRTVGYKEIFDHLNGEISLEKAVELIKRNSRRYAKKQLTYWGRDKDIEWMTI